MKRVRCPKCDNKITFDETKYAEGQKLVFQCPQCNHQFGIRIGVMKQKEEAVAHLLVIENQFHFKQLLPLRMGNNIIGKYCKGAKTTVPIETSDPSIDHCHCNIDISRDKNGNLKYILSDGPSYTGTFVGDEILGDREKRIIDDGTLFTMGATSVILKAGKIESEK